MRFEFHVKVEGVWEGELSWSEGRQRSRLVLHTEHGLIVSLFFSGGAESFKSSTTSSFCSERRVQRYKYNHQTSSLTLDEERKTTAT